MGQLGATRSWAALGLPRRAPQRPSLGPEAASRPSLCNRQVEIALKAIDQGLAGHAAASAPASVAMKRSGRAMARARPRRQHLEARERFCWGVRQKRMPKFNSAGQQHSAPEVAAEHRGLLVQHLPWSGQQKEALAKTFVIDQIPPYRRAMEPGPLIPLQRCPDLSGADEVVAPRWLLAPPGPREGDWQTRPPRT